MSTPEAFDPTSWQPGDTVTNGTSTHTLLARKDESDAARAGEHGVPFWPGWWFTNHEGGLADFVALEQRWHTTSPVAPAGLELSPSGAMWVPEHT
jgi:hypothetical protein